MTNIVGLDHVLLAMPSGAEDRARWFYHDLLGLTEILKPEPLASRGGCWFEGPGTYLHLGVQKNFSPAEKAHPAILVRDLEQLSAGLVDAGIEIIPDKAIPEVRRFYTNDPFGNRIEFIQDGDGFSQG